MTPLSAPCRPLLAASSMPAQAARYEYPYRPRRDAPGATAQTREVALGLAARKASEAEEEGSKCTYRRHHQLAWPPGAE